MTPEQIIEHTVTTSRLRMFTGPDSGLLEVRGEAGLGEQVVQALAEAGYQVVRREGPKGIETR